MHSLSTAWMVSSAHLYMQWTHFGWQTYFQSQHSTISVTRHWKGTWYRHRHRCASIWMYLCPRRGMHAVPLVRLFTPLVFCPLCGCTIGEKRGPVIVSQKTPAGWLSWRLLTSAWWYAFSRDLTGKGVHLVGNPWKERERLGSVERDHPGGIDLRAHTESSSISKVY